MGNKFFSKKNFSDPVSDFMTENVSTLKNTDPIKDCIDLMQKHSFGSIPIIDDSGKVFGILSEKDLVRKYAQWSENPDEITAADICTQGVLSLYKDNGLFDVLEVMAKREIRHVPIVNTENKIQGMVSSMDIIKKIAAHFKEFLGPHGIDADWTHHTVDKISDRMSIDNVLPEKIEGESVFYTTLRNFSRTLTHHFESTQSIGEVLEYLSNEKHTIGFITEFQTKLVGSISEREFVSQFFLKGISKNEPITRITLKEPIKMLRKHNLGHALNALSTHGHRNIVIVNADHFPMGNLSVIDILRFFHQKISE